MINERFIEYFRDNFFKDKPDELEAFLWSIEKWIPRTIRIKPGKEEQVKKNLEEDGWILTKTNIDGIYSTDRQENFDPLERRLGFSMDHLLWNFYIQELAAAHPVDILANSQINTESFLILDMASSPGGKTTQLGEYFPNSFIIANEPTRERLPQLLQNLERMWSAHVGITLYPGQLYRHHTEIFDRILLDAPCSGEWTLFKWTDAVKHWHLKNIKDIARLQTKLLDAALYSLKVWGEMIYSTCSLNLLENEGVLEAMREKYDGSFEIIFQKKFWPHIDKTGGFFVSKIRKISSLAKKNKNNDENLTEWEKSDSKTPSNYNKELRLYRGNISPWKIQENITLYEHSNKILAVKNTDIWDKIRDQVFLMRYGEQIGVVDHGKFIVGHRAWKYLDISTTSRFSLQNEIELDNYLRGENIENIWIDEYVIIEYQGQIIWLEYRKWNIISNTFSHEWRRK
jgi:16S rRNA (cytosine1407-C5)-methyltransferase